VGQANPGVVFLDFVIGLSRNTRVSGCHKRQELTVIVLRGDADLDLLIIEWAHFASPG
jgi:hypothetical protein